MNNSELRDTLIDSMNRDRDWLEYWMNAKLDRLVDMEFYEKIRDAWKIGYDQGKEFK